MSTNNHESHSSHKSHLSHKSSKSARAARTLTSPKNLPVRLALSPVPKICPCGSHSHKSPKSARAARTLRWRKLAACAQFKIQNSKFKILLLRLALSALSSPQTGQTDK